MNIKYEGKTYTIRKGRNDGKYIIRNGKKVYVNIASYPGNVHGWPVGFK